MQEILPEEFNFKWSTAPDGCTARKRQLQAIIPPPHVKRQKCLLQAPFFAESGEDNSSGVGDQSCVQISQGEETPFLYPCVVYEGEIATVKLGVGQMVMLEGCAMVQVVEGQAAMLGYSFPQGTDVLVCSSSELTEVVTIEAGQGNYHGTQLEDGSEGNLLGCQLRFASHTLGQQQVCASGAGLSFRLEFVGSLGSLLGKKMGQELSEQQNQVQVRNDDNQLNVDMENEIDDQLEALVEGDAAKKRKSYGQNTDSGKRQRVVEKLMDSCNSSSTSLPLKAVESAGSAGVPVIAIAMQRMLESLGLLGS